ncbi:hypothetical protein DFH09DRAFT_1096147 [Mycena vulgaris]|nr:hypothetical protein DFH09DRAFT_1096147 [Mycena vulgaris]
MPSLPLSPPAAPTFAASQFIGLVVFVVVVLSVSGLYFLGLHLGAKFAEQRARTSDTEKASQPASVVVLAEENVDLKTCAAASALVAARANLPAKAKTHVVAFVKGSTASKVVQSMFETHSFLGSASTSARSSIPTLCPRASGPVRLASAMALRPSAPPSSPTSLSPSLHRPAAHLVSALTLKRDPVVIAPTSKQPPLAVTLATFVSRAYHMHDTDSDSDGDDTIDDEPLDFDGLRMVRSTENSWMPVRAGSRKEAKAQDLSSHPAAPPSFPALVSAPRTVLGVSHIANTPLRRAALRTVSIIDKENATVHAHIQVPRRALLAI